MTRNRRSTRYYSNLQERRVAKAVGGRQTSNSGAPRFTAGDVRTDMFLLECKTCTEPRQSMSIKKEWFTKNKEEAFAMHKDYSALVFDFGDGENHYVIDENLFIQLLTYLEEKEKNYENT